MEDDYPQAMTATKKNYLALAIDTKTPQLAIYL